MDTGDLTLSEETIEQIRKDVVASKPEDEELDRKYTTIQTVTNIFCAVMAFDEEKHDKYINYIFGDGIVWSYTDYDGIISKDFLLNFVLEMKAIDEPIKLKIAEISGGKVLEIGAISFEKSGCENFGVFTFSNSEVKETVEELIFYIKKLYFRTLGYPRK